METIIFNSLRQKARQFNLNIDIKADFDAFVNLETDSNEIVKNIHHRIEYVHHLINLDAFEKVHFGKTIQNDETSIDQYTLYPTETHKKYMVMVDFAKLLDFDLFNKKSFGEFVLFVYHTTSKRNKLCNIPYMMFENLDNFDQLVHGESFMKTTLPLSEVNKKNILEYKNDILEYKNDIPINQLELKPIVLKDWKQSEKNEPFINPKSNEFDNEFEIINHFSS